MEENLKEGLKEDFQYIKVSKINYPFVITKADYSPMEFVASIANPKLSLVKKGKEKDGKGKKCKKQQKNKEEATLVLSKQDVKMGIYAIKPPKEEKAKKTKQKLPQQIQQKIVKQIEAISQLKVSNEQQQLSQHPQQAQQKSKKGKKNKAQSLKKDKGLNEEELLSSNAVSDQNKQVDDLIKQIKNKKESQEGKKKNETIKMRFINKYRYLFTLDPAQRLKLREQSATSLPIEIVECLFLLLRADSIEGDKEQMKEAVVLIDNLIEIASQMRDMLFLKPMIDCIVLYYNDFIVNCPFISENSLLFLFNSLYSFIKLKLEMNSNEPFSKEQFAPLSNKLSQSASMAIEALTNDNKLLKQNDKLMNSIIPFIFKEIIFIDDSNPTEPANPTLCLFLSKVSSVTNGKDTSDDFDKFKVLYENMSLFNKLSALFDYRKELLYSLNIKASKYIEAALNQMQIKVISSTLQQYGSLIEDILLSYLNNFDLFYVIDNKFYDDIFTLLMLYSDKYASAVNYPRLFKDLAFRTYSFEYDDSLMKFILYIMKLFKLFNGLFSSSSPNEAYLGYYVAYFNKVLDFILDVNQQYLKEKYIALLHKEIEEHYSLPFISMALFEFIKLSIEETIQNEASFSKMMKTIKEMTRFYKRYPSIKEHIALHLKKNEELSDVKGTICRVMLYNFFSVSSQSDCELLLSCVDYQSVISIDEETISFLMNYFIEEELENLSQIEVLLYEKSKVAIENVITSTLVSVLKGSEDDFGRINSGLRLSKRMEKRFDIEELLKMRDEANGKWVDGLVLYHINSNWSDVNWGMWYKWKGDEVIDEIRDVNNKAKSYKSNYLSEGDDNEFYGQLIGFLLQIHKLLSLLKENPSYYKADDIVIENEPIQQKTDCPSKDSEVKSKVILLTEANAKEDEAINFDIILIAFNQIFSHPLFLINDATSHQQLFLLSQIQEFVLKVLSNELIFSNLKLNKLQLISFLRKFIDFKSQLLLLKEQLSLQLKQLTSITKAKEITQALTRISLISQCEDNITQLISSRCSEQLPYLYPEEDIYSLLFTKDRKFLLNVTNNLCEVYKYRILNEQKVESLLLKAQDEENDYLENVVYEIFGKKVIQYLEYPEELIDFLTRMNEGLKYNLTLTKKKLYEALFPFFYIWKNIMNKLENGFRLYTSDKQNVQVIENYKTLLKFVVNYLERNSKLYEMFLLIMVSLLHLIDEQQESIDPINPGAFETFNEAELTDSFDGNTYLFLLANLFKFVKIFPSLVKFYYDESKNKLKNVFKKLISSMILPKLLRDLYERIKSNEKTLKDNKITLVDTISPHFIQFYFTINEEIKFNIEIKVPPIFPLKKIDISIKCNATIEERKMLNISMNLNHTLNSSIDNITDNLLIWSEDVKQLVIKGHEPCPICYFYLHTTDKSLPGLYCHVCKKKFHGLCLKEWFKNLRQKGQNPSCPMCRSEWKKKI